MIVDWFNNGICIPYMYNGCEIENIHRLILVVCALYSSVVVTICHISLNCKSTTESYCSAYNLFLRMQVQEILKAQELEVIIQTIVFYLTKIV